MITDVTYHELTGLELLKFRRDVGKLFEKLCGEQLEPDLLERICECAVLGFYCLTDPNGKSVFSSPEEVLDNLSLRSLVSIPEEYEQRFPEEESFYLDRFHRQEETGKNV